MNSMKIPWVWFFLFGFVGAFLSSFVLHILKGHPIIFSFYVSLGGSVITGLIYAVIFWVIWQIIRAVVEFIKALK